MILFLVWGAGRLLAPAEVQEGAPWKAWGPLLSARNLSFKPFQQNVQEFPEVLANLLRDGGDRWALRLVTVIAVVAVGLWLAGQRSTPREGPAERWRIAGLALLAGLLFLLLPFDIRGAVYYLNTRYAHLAAPLLVAAVPPVAGRLRPALLVAGALAAVVLAAPLGAAFRAFDAEAAPLLRFAEETDPGPRIMGLVFDPGSRVMHHPVFLHAAAVPARLRGGITNFSFARTPHSPIRYRGTPPPTFPSEWRPDGFRWESMGPAYSHFLVRGVDPSDPRQPGRLRVTLVDTGSGMAGWRTGADEHPRAGGGAARRRGRARERAGRGLGSWPAGCSAASRWAKALPAELRWPCSRPRSHGGGAPGRHRDVLGPGGGEVGAARAHRLRSAGFSPNPTFPLGPRTIQSPTPGFSSPACPTGRASGRCSSHDRFAAASRWSRRWSRMSSGSSRSAGPR